MFWLWITLSFIAGFIISLFIFAGSIARMIFGTIRLDDGGSLYLEMDRNPKYLRDRKYAVFRVQLTDWTPHE